MKTSLFFGWLERFQAYISKTPGRRALLLIDNCSAHGTVESLPSLSNVRVVFLPPNCTSKIQPMDAGIIAALKLRYKRMHMERALDNLDAEVKNIYKVDVLTAMRWFKRAWTELPSSIIANCWHHTGLTGGSNDYSVEEEEAQITRQLEEQVAQLVVPRVRMSIAELLNPMGEDDVQQITTDEELVASIVEEHFGNDNSSAESDDDSADPLPDTKEQLQALAVTKRVAECMGVDDASFLSSLRKMQRSVRLEAVRSAKQTTIDMFFN